MKKPMRNKIKSISKASFNRRIASFDIHGRRYYLFELDNNEQKVIEVDLKKVQQIFILLGFKTVVSLITGRD